MDEWNSLATWRFGRRDTGVARAESRNPDLGEVLADQVYILRPSLVVHAGAARRGRAEHGIRRVR